MNKVSYRKGGVSDLNEIKTVTLKSYRQFSNVLSIENMKEWEENLGNDETYMDLFKTATCFVALYDGKIVGVSFLVPRGNRYKWFAAEWSYIRLVGVLPEFSGKGIGRKLTELCVELAKASGEKVISLHTSEFQDAARHIYESMGFKKHKEFKLFERKYWVYVMPLGHATAFEFNFHKAGIEDVKILVEYRIRFAIELVGEQPKEKIEFLRNQMTDYFSIATVDDSCISIIAKWKDEVAGIGSIHLREMPGNIKNPSGKWGYIMNMYTVPKFRRKGICNEILNCLINEGKQNGITGFELHATKDGEPIYRKNGFELHYEPTLRKIIST